MESIKKILDSHGIQHKTVNDELHVLDVYSLNGVAGSKWVNTNNWSFANFLTWLGY